MQILSWNIRGLGSFSKKRFLSKLIKKKRPDMVFIQETKLESVDRLAIQRIWGVSNVDYACSNSEGASGGLLTIWNSSFFKPVNVTVNRSFILLQGTIDNFPCIIVNIYAPNVALARHVLWDDYWHVKQSIRIHGVLGVISMK